MSEFEKQRDGCLLNRLKLLESVFNDDNLNITDETGASNFKLSHMIRIKGAQDTVAPKYGCYQTQRKIHDVELR